MVNIAFLGFGTVGKGSYKILNEKKEQIKYIIGEEVNVSKILKRNLSDVADYKENLFTTDFSEILEDDSIKLVVEMTGDLKASHKYITESLKAKKHVVTANKAVVSEYFEEFNQLSKQNDVLFLYEASVGGSIPIINNLITQSAINNLYRVRGILNGTSNYLLSKMYLENIDYEDVLKDAQKLGYAESNPYDDVEGIDALRKLTILSNISFKGIIKNDDILHHGIANIKEVDIRFFKEMGLKPKLIAESVNENGTISAVVEPVLLNTEDKMYSIDGVENAVEIFGENYSSLLFTGEGAGSLPTGNAIVSDILCSLKKATLKVNLSHILKATQDLEGYYYIRAPKNLKLNIDLKEKKIMDDYQILKTQKIKRQDVFDQLQICDDYFVARFEV